MTIPRSAGDRRALRHGSCAEEQGGTPPGDQDIATSASGEGIPAATAATDAGDTLAGDRTSGTGAVRSGRCLCGQVTFTLSEEPVGARACWCRVCQYLSSGNASLGVFFRKQALAVTGETHAYASASEAGNIISRRFCQRCGTPLFSEVLSEGEHLVVRLGALDDREGGEPQAVIWTRSAPSWVRFYGDRRTWAGHRREEERHFTQEKSER